jgi:hypothetical protein
MTDAEAPTNDALNADASARSSDSTREEVITISRTAAGLSRSISALQRCIETLERQQASAVRRGERRDAEAIAGQLMKVKEQKAFYQSLYDREMLG